MGNYDVLFRVDNSDFDHVDNDEAKPRKGSKASRASAGAHEEQITIPQGMMRYSDIVTKYPEDDYIFTINHGNLSPRPPEVLTHIDKDGRDKVDDPSIYHLKIESKNGSIADLNFNKRFCGKCEKELDSSAGRKPTRVILTLGPSDAGKTVFLLALFETLSKNGGYTLPPINSGAKTALTVRTAAYAHDNRKSSDSSLESMRAELFDKKGLRLLPETTLFLDKVAPLTLNVNIDFNNGSESSGVLLHLRDVPGEWILNEQDYNDEYNKLIRQLPKFDGFIMILDPFTFDYSDDIFDSAGEGKKGGQERREYIRILHERLAKDLSPIMGGAKIVKPTAVVVTKGDHLLKEENIVKLKNKGIERNRKIFCDDPKLESLDSEYFNEINDDVHFILKKLAPTAINMLEYSFGNIFFSLVSSLSRSEPLNVEPITINEGDAPRMRIMNENAINPWRTADPFLRLLMSLDLIPPFDDVDVRTRVESNKEYNARNADYRKKLNAWGEIYHAEWDSYGEQTKLLDDSGVKGFFGTLRGGKK